MKEKLLEYLSQFVTENRRQKMDEVMEMRTRHFTVVLEDIFQPHNASAVVRTCDCFGVQDLHIIENRNSYRVNPDVTLGSSNWVDIIQYNKKDTNNTRSCYQALKSKGYKIYATTPHTNDIHLDQLPLDQKLAIVFGTEKEGLTKDAIDLADGYVKVPMTGFTESLNISVTAAIFIHQIMYRLWNSSIDWKLSKEEKEELKLQWIKNSIKKADLLEKEFFSRLQ